MHTNMYIYICRIYVAMKCNCSRAPLHLRLNQATFDCTLSHATYHPQ